MSTPQNLQAEAWVRTVKAAALRWPVLGSTVNIHALMRQPNGLPYRKIGSRVLFNVSEVEAWLEKLPGSNLQAAS